MCVQIQARGQVKINGLTRLANGRPELLTSRFVSHSANLDQIMSV